jgi:hypothetical protein
MSSGTVLELSESVAKWRDHACNAFKILWIAALLQTGDKPISGDWPSLPRYFDEAAGMRVQRQHWASAHDDAWERLAVDLDWWLWTAGVVPSIESRKSGVRAEFGCFESLVLVIPSKGPSIPIVVSARLFGIIGLQLLMAVTGSRGLAVCMECKQPYFSRRKLGKRRLCETCRLKASWRHASMRHYRKKKGEKAYGKKARAK